MSQLYPRKTKSKKNQNFQDFPAICFNDEKNVFVSYINRPTKIHPELIVASWDKVNGLRTLATIASPEITAFDTPALAPSKNGCILVFSAEIKGKWQIGYVNIFPGKKTGEPHFLPLKGTVNAKPAVAHAGNRHCIVWESNALGKRGIYTCWLTSGKPGSVIRLSPPNISAGNPAITALKNGDVYVAWDAFRKEQWDIYGRVFTEGKWQKEEQISSDPRIERYAALAASTNGEVWIAWEAAAADPKRINHYVEQKIVVAKRTKTGFEMPVGLFGKKGPQPGTEICKRPAIALDSAGRLHLSFRKNTQMHNGKKIRTGSFWHPEIWTYSGKSWFGPADIQSDWGWWRRIPILTAKSGKLFAAIQEGIGISYQLANKSASRVVIEQLHPETPAVKARTRAFKMPETSFDLPAYIRKFSLRLPEQTVNLNKNKLNLYWGDLHEHTAMSQCARTRNPPSPDLFLNQHVMTGSILPP